MFASPVLKCGNSWLEMDRVPRKRRLSAELVHDTFQTLIFPSNFVSDVSCEMPILGGQKGDNPGATVAEPSSVSSASDELDSTKNLQHPVDTQTNVDPFKELFEQIRAQVEISDTGSDFESITTDYKVSFTDNISNYPAETMAPHVQFSTDNSSVLSSQIHKTPLTPSLDLSTKGISPSSAIQLSATSEQCSTTDRSKYALNYQDQDYFTSSGVFIEQLSPFDRHAHIQSSSRSSVHSIGNNLLSQISAQSATHSKSVENMHLTNSSTSCLGRTKSCNSAGSDQMTASPNVLQTQIVSIVNDVFDFHTFTSDTHLTHTGYAATPVTRTRFENRSSSNTSGDCSVLTRGNLSTLEELIPSSSCSKTTVGDDFSHHKSSSSSWRSSKSLWNSDHTIVSSHNKRSNIAHIQEIRPQSSDTQIDPVYGREIHSCNLDALFTKDSNLPLNDTDVESPIARVYGVTPNKRRASVPPMDGQELSATSSFRRQLSDQSTENSIYCGDNSNKSPIIKHSCVSIFSAASQNKTQLREHVSIDSIDSDYNPSRSKKIQQQTSGTSFSETSPSKSQMKKQKTVNSMFSGDISNSNLTSGTNFGYISPYRREQSQTALMTCPTRKSSPEPYNENVRRLGHHFQEPSTFMSQPPILNDSVHNERSKTSPKTFHNVKADPCTGDFLDRPTIGLFESRVPSLGALSLNVHPALSCSENSSSYTIVKLCDQQISDKEICNTTTLNEESQQRSPSLNGYSQTGDTEILSLHHSSSEQSSMASSPGSLVSSALTSESSGRMHNCWENMYTSRVISIQYPDDPVVNGNSELSSRERAAENGFDSSTKIVKVSDIIDGIFDDVMNCLQ